MESSPASAASMEHAAARFDAPAIDVQRIDGGAVLLRSPRALGTHPVSVVWWLRHWAGLQPDQTVLARRGGDGGWHVREIPAWRAVKDYTCPGCGRTIPPGLAHLVAWRSDWIMGDEDAGAHRRHWHPLCWRTRASR